MEFVQKLVKGKSGGTKQSIVWEEAFVNGFDLRPGELRRFFSVLPAFRAFRCLHSFVDACCAVLPLAFARLGLSLCAFSVSRSVATPHGYFAVLGW
jgi:hypothetical protein